MRSFVRLLFLVVLAPVGAREASEPHAWESVLELTADLPASENAWTRWRAALASIDPLSEVESSALDGADPAAVAALLAPRTPALRRLRLHEGERVQLPRTRAATEGLVDEVMRLPEAARLLAAASRLEVLEGRTDLAVETVVAMLRIGFGSVRDPGSMLAYLRGLAVVRLALDEVRRLAARPELPAGEAAVLERAVLGEARALEVGFANALRAEYWLYFRDVLHKFPESRDADAALHVLASLGGPPPGGPRVLGEARAVLVDKPATLALYGIPLARGVRLLDTDWRWRPGLFEAGLARAAEVWRSESPLLLRHVRGGARGPLTGVDREALLRELAEVSNPVGRIWVMLASGNRDAFFQTSVASSADLRVTAAWLALRRVLAQHRPLPERLAEVVELEDPFSGGPLRYDRNRAAVWSVGHDGVDDGGSSEPGPDGRPRDLVRALPASLLAR